MSETKMNTAIEIVSISETESSDESDFYAIVDDSDEDPTFDLVQDTQISLSKLSIKKKKPSDENKIPQLDENEERSFEHIEKLIHEGKFKKLKKEDCKIYLKRFGLRVTDKKEVLVERIKKHLEVKNGGGEEKYPVSSFVINCKGDACTRDVVLFEQTSCKKSDKKETQNAKGLQNGTRIVAGRIIKESYGAEKQQHTFTIEVLWSKGKKPYPALYPLRIKGRNLYKLKTMRQRWENEEEREKILQEKHNRGDVARLCRERRILERETRKIQIQNRITNQSQKNQAPKLLQERTNLPSNNIPIQIPQRKITPVQWDPRPDSYKNDITSGPHRMFDRVNHEQQQNSRTYHAMWGPPHRENRTNAVVSDTRGPPHRENRKSAVIPDTWGPPQWENRTNDVIPDTWGPPQRENGIAHMWSPPQREKRREYGGPGSRYNSGPGAWFNDGGPSARYNSGGPGVRYNDGGPGVRYNDGGPGARFNGGPVQREVCRHFVRGHCWYGQECKFIHDGEN